MLQAKRAAWDQWSATVSWPRRTLQATKVGRSGVHGWASGWAHVFRGRALEGHGGSRMRVPAWHSKGSSAMCAGSSLRASAPTATRSPQGAMEDAADGVAGAARGAAQATADAASGAAGAARGAAQATADAASGTAGWATDKVCVGAARV